MIRVTRIVGLASDTALAARLHQIEHRGGVERIVLSRGDMSRRRQQITSDRGTEVALLLDRDATLQNGSIVLLEDERAVVVYLDEPEWLILRPSTLDRALELGYFAGNMHWKVRFSADCLHIALDGPKADYLARMQRLLDDSVQIVSQEPAHEHAHPHGHGHGHGHTHTHTHTPAGAPTN